MKLSPAFNASPTIQREAQSYASHCACSRAVEQARAELHSSLHNVLVIDARLFYNGVGNSLSRWLALLRFGTAAGRATFLWMSDRESHRLGHPLTAPPSAPGSSSPSFRPGRRLQQQARVPNRERVGKGKPLSTRAESEPVDLYPRFSSQRPRTLHQPKHVNGFDLGDYFVAHEVDYRWSRASRERVANAMRPRGLNLSSALLVTYHCRRHTWACMQPTFEWGQMDAPMHDSLEAKAPLSGFNAGYAPGPRAHLHVAHDRESDGALLAWLAGRQDPLIVLRVHPEQTALEPSAAVSAAVISGLWKPYGAPALGTHVCERFESMLHDCKEPKRKAGQPCFNWQRPVRGVSPTTATAHAHCTP
ncbi:MAG: hypothetical protein SGPRY_011890, partial [Prymnesium sp.]